MEEPQQNVDWGQHLPSGWHGIFDRLLEQLTRLDPAFKITQAKQKFGELRVYLRDYAPGALDLIDEATRKSKQTCEICGSKGSLRETKGYYQTLCEEHSGESARPSQSPIAASFWMTKNGVKKREP